MYFRLHTYLIPENAAKLHISPETTKKKWQKFCF